MRIAWISYLDPYEHRGGGELAHRMVIAEGLRRGHELRVSGFLGARRYRALRYTGLHRRLRVDWEADLYVLANLRNCPQISHRIPDSVVERALGTGRAVLFQDAWVDVCSLDLPCHGEVSTCPARCDRAWGRSIYERATIAVFVSPRHRDLAAAVLGDLPPVVLCPPMVDPDRFRVLHGQRDIDVLYVGTISEAKGYRELVARFGPARLTLAGPSALDEPVQGTWLGEIDQDALPALYNRAKTFAHLPRWDEPQGRTVVEAALCGCALELNSRVGVASYPRELWTDAATVRGNPARFWEDLEARVEDLT